MTIKYNVSGAKARNGKEILPMAFSDRAEAERFAKYHEGLSVPQNLRKHPGNITVVGTFSAEGHPQNIPKNKGTCIDGKEHGPWADNYTYCTTCGLYDFDKFKPTAEQTKAAKEFFAQPAESLALHCQEVGRLTRVQDIIKVTTAPPCHYPPLPTTTVGNPNADLEAAYEMGFLAAATPAIRKHADEYFQTASYADQRRSDLKELVSYDCSI